MKKILHKLFAGILWLYLTWLVTFAVFWQFLYMAPPLQAPPPAWLAMLNGIALTGLVLLMIPLSPILLKAGLLNPEDPGGMPSFPTPAGTFLVVLFYLIAIGIGFYLTRNSA